MIQDAFFARLHEAEAAGLNKEWALKVAYLEISLDDALGGMDTDQESGVIECDPNTIVNDCGCDFDPNCKRCFPF